MYGSIKKYTPFLLVIIILGFVFLPKLFSLAREPAFEIYGGSVTCDNIHPYPLVGSAQAVVSGDIVTITAHICDVSGVILATATIEDTNTGFPDEIGYVDFAMNNDSSGTGTWEAIINLTDNTRINWDENTTYNVDILATDTLFNRNKDANGAFIDYEHVASFVISGSMTTAITDFEYSPSPAQAGESVSISAVLKDSDNDPIPEQTLVFTDVTNSGNPISAQTNASGEATVSYVIPSGSSGITVRVSYSGGGTNLPVDITENILVDSCGTVAESGGITLCANVLYSTGGGTLSLNIISVIPYPQQVTFSAQLTPHTSMQKIYFYDENSGSPVLVGTGLTNESGTATMTYTPAIDSTFKAVYLGNFALNLPPAYDTDYIEVGDEGGCQMSGGIYLCVKDPVYDEDLNH